MTYHFIPIELQGELQNQTTIFIKKALPKVSWRIIADARGKFIYLRRLMNDNSYINLGRLTYSGDIEKMPFAIFRYNTEKYDSKRQFPGSHYLNGTLEGALQAILEAFP